MAALIQKPGSSPVGVTSFESVISIIVVCLDNFDQDEQGTQAIREFC